jgi:hypothetical protein
VTRGEGAGMTRLRQGFGVAGEIRMAKLETITNHQMKTIFDLTTRSSHFGIPSSLVIRAL